MSANSQQLQIILNVDLFPKDAGGVVKYAMAVASANLFKLKEPPSAKNPIILDGYNGYNRWQMKFVWTAFMVFGQQLPNMKFGHEAIKTDPDYSKEELEGYYWKRFNKDSYYEEYFKPHLTNDMVKLTEFPELFEGISSAEYPTIEEQEDVRRKQMEEIRLKEEQKELEEEQKKAEEQRIREEQALAEKKRLEEEPERVRQESITLMSDRLIKVINDSQESTNLLTISAYISQGDVNYRTYGGNTPLILALSLEKYSIAEYLLKRGADPRIANDAGIRAMDFVSSSSVLHELILKREKELALQEYSSAIRASMLLYEEASKPDASLKIIKDYLGLGADINYKDAKGYTVLMLAADNQSERLVEYLLKQGANPLLSNIHGEKASDLASQSSSIYPLLKKAEKKAGLENLTAEEKASLLLQELVGSMEASAEKIDELLDSGADIDYQNPKGFTALMLAVDAGNERIAEYLLEHGANPLIRNQRGYTARRLASRQSGLSPILKGYELIVATISDDLPAVKALLRTDNTFIDFQNSEGYSALLIAVEQNRVKVVNYLLEQGASLEITSDEGKSVFELASSEAMMRLLQLEENSDEQEIEQIEKPRSKRPVERSHQFFKTAAPKSHDEDVLVTDNQRGYSSD